MIYKKFIIESDTEETIGIALDIIYNDSERLVYIADTIACVNGCYTYEELNKLLVHQNLLNIHIIEINDTKIKSSCKTLNESFHPMIKKFVDDTNITDDINYFLELISSRGGTEYLTGMERQRLYELTKQMQDGEEEM